MRSFASLRTGNRKNARYYTMGKLNNGLIKGNHYVFNAAVVLRRWWTKLLIVLSLNWFSVIVSDSKEVRNIQNAEMLPTLKLATQFVKSAYRTSPSGKTDGLCCHGVTWWPHYWKGSTNSRLVVYLLLLDTLWRLYLLSVFHMLRRLVSLSYLSLYILLRPEVQYCGREGPGIHEQPIDFEDLLAYTHTPIYFTFLMTYTPSLIEIQDQDAISGWRGDTHTFHGSRCWIILCHILSPFRIWQRHVGVDTLYCVHLME